MKLAKQSESKEISLWEKFPKLPANVGLWDWNTVSEGFVFFQSKNACLKNSILKICKSNLHFMFGNRCVEIVNFYVDMGCWQYFWGFPKSI